MALLSEEQQATATGIICSKFGEFGHVVFEIWELQKDRQTNRHTDMLITIVCTLTTGEVKGRLCVLKTKTAEVE